MNQVADLEQAEAWFKLHAIHGQKFEAPGVLRRGLGGTGILTSLILLVIGVDRFSVAATGEKQQ
ncbi:MAG: hypothetical protein FJ224_11770 [Lentisphaerae bacterium]|nr:hypothetical protein [Lentisphaerota bacterium]